jgi:hypothetical protein
MFAPAAADTAVSLPAVEPVRIGPFRFIKSYYFTFPFDLRDHHSCAAREFG